MQVLNELSAAQNQPELFSQRYRDSIGKGTDWQDEIFRTAIAQNHQLSFSGGSKHNKYYVSLAYMNQDGILKKHRLRTLQCTCQLRPGAFRKVRCIAGAEHLAHREQPAVQPDRYQ